MSFGGNVFHFQASFSLNHSTQVFQDFWGNSWVELNISMWNPFFGVTDTWFVQCWFFLICMNGARVLNERNSTDTWKFSICLLAVLRLQVWRPGWKAWPFKLSLKPGAKAPSQLRCPPLIPAPLLSSLLEVQIIRVTTRCTDQGELHPFEIKAGQPAPRYESKALSRYPAWSPKIAGGF